MSTFDTPTEERSGDFRQPRFSIHPRYSTMATRIISSKSDFTPGFDAICAVGAPEEAEPGNGVRLLQKIIR